MRAIWLWGPVIVYMAAIFSVSALPQPPLPVSVPDKLAHALAYAGLAILVVRALTGSLLRPAAVRVLVLAALIAMAYGASDEFHQRFVPGRSADVVDWLADSMGALVGAVACGAWGIIATRPATVRRASRHEL